MQPYNKCKSCVTDFSCVSYFNKMLLQNCKVSYLSISRYKAYNKNAYFNIYYKYPLTQLL